MPLRDPLPRQGATRKDRREHRERMRTAAAVAQVCITTFILALTIYGLVTR